MKKLIMLIFLLLSLTTMILFTVSISQLFSMLGLGTFQFEDIISMFQEIPINDVIPALGLILWGLFQLYGIPVIVFLVSIIGLTSKK